MVGESSCDDSDLLTQASNPVRLSLADDKGGHRACGPDRVRLGVGPGHRESPSPPHTCRIAQEMTHRWSVLVVPDACWPSFVREVPAFDPSCAWPGDTGGDTAEVAAREGGHSDSLLPPGRAGSTHPAPPSDLYGRPQPQPRPPYQVVTPQSL